MTWQGAQLEKSGGAFSCAVESSAMGNGLRTLLIVLAALFVGVALFVLASLAALAFARYAMGGSFSLW